MKNNTNILIWVITILVILNLTIVGTILIKSNNCVTSKNNNTIELNNSKNHLGKYFKDKLNLSYKQHNKFREIRHQYHNNSDMIKNNMQTIRKQIVTELGKENSNKEILNELANKIGNQHKELKLLTSQYYLDMKTVCNSKQKEKLHQIFKGMLDENGNFLMPKRKK